MADSWTGEPGAMSYDDDRFGPDLNATCPDCREEFYRSPEDTGWLCHTCCDLRDLRAVTANDEIFTAAVRAWFRRTDPVR